jgi:crossover junction endodeoxyribonuclease RuvC
VIVLGIDPGTAALGYGIVDSTAGRVREVDHGCLATSPDASLPDRLLAIHALVDELIEIHRPEVLAVERLFFSRNVQTAFAVGQARGVVLLAAAQHGVRVREATPNEVKSAIAGYGAADKEQVQRMVQMVLGMPERPRPDDAADALAIATWAANTAGSAGARLSPVMDRASIDPIARGESGYQRAVREALSRERTEAVAAGNGTGGSVTPAGGAGSAVTPAGGAVGAVTPAAEGEPEEPGEPVEAAPARPAKRSAP